MKFNLKTPPERWRTFHRWMAWFWLANIPLALATGLKDSVTYLIFVSLMTAFSGEKAAEHGTEIQVKQDQDS